VSKKYGLMINVDKTKVTATCINKCDILVNIEKLQQLSNVPDDMMQNAQEISVQDLETAQGL